MDTDSVIFLNRGSDVYQVPLGNFLGDMTDELEGGYIKEFVSCGPKQYAYIRVKDDKEDTVVKIRGFTLTSTSSLKLNFQTMKKMLLQWLADENKPIEIVFPQIRRNRDHTIVTRVSSKSYGIVYDKCRVLPSTVCVPFGFK